MTAQALTDTARLGRKAALLRLQGCRQRAPRPSLTAKVTPLFRSRRMLPVSAVLARICETDGWMRARA